MTTLALQGGKQHSDFDHGRILPAGTQHLHHPPLIMADTAAAQLLALQVGGACTN
jgi:hypothetical protein